MWAQELDYQEIQENKTHGKHEKRNQKHREGKWGRSEYGGHFTKDQHSL